ncbi:GNAT family N-acetyltransferase [Plantibacter sp. 2H11-2]|uniref:GNAT family N-acetyltransferase n=1 Tax=Plantibacter sp. 2H11-2 TaxID=3414431 RepID=UPI003CF0E82F
MTRVTAGRIDHALAFTEAVLGDVDEIVDMVNRAYSRAPGAPGWAGERSFQPGDRTDALEVSRFVAEPLTTVLVGRRDGRLVSCCCVTGRDDATAYLGLFAVDPDRQSGGLGRATMAAGESVAVMAFEAQRIVVEVMEHHEPLREWYLRLGYWPTGSRSVFPGSIAAEPVWLVEMDKALAPIKSTPLARS